MRMIVNIPFLTYLLPFIIALIITAVSTPIALIFIKKMGIFDDPKLHKHPAIIHKTPIPRGGGIPLFIGFFITSLVFLPITPITTSLFFASFLALLIGTLDDKLDVSPYLRFIGNIFTAAIIVGSGISIPFITNPLGGILHLDTLKIATAIMGIPFSFSIGDILALVWIVWVMNMLNWSKGVDGQMPGIVAISAIVIGLLSLRYSDSTIQTEIVATLSFIIAGISAGFLIFNFYPAKIFPGYGATFVYLLLSVVSILSGAKLATAILVMGVPMVDGAFTILRRIFTGKSPFWHDKKHLHHLLLKLGFPQRSIALFYWGISAILGTLSLILSSEGKVFVIIMLGVIVGGALLFLHFVMEKADEKNAL